MSLLSLTPLVEVDLSSIFFKMKSEHEMLGGELIDYDVADHVYRQFLTLRQRHPSATLVPSAMIDMVWHYHILDTRKYIADCDRLFGGYLHHDPYFGLNGDEDRKANENAWEQTKALWQQEFDEPMIGLSHRCSTKDCR
jgi:hypothetical protein